MNIDIAIIVNAGSGTQQSHQSIRLIKEAFSDYKITPEIKLVSPGGDIGNTTKTLIDQGYKTIVAAGGDGTINAVVKEIYQHDILLGIIPLGTFNHLAKDLRIPINIEQSIEIIAGGKFSTIDLAEVNKNIFINNSSLGFYPKFSKNKESYQARKYSKYQAMILSLYDALFNNHKVSGSVQSDSSTLRFKTSFLFLGNNLYDYQGLSIGSRELLNEGQLSLYIAHQASLRKLIYLYILGIFKQLKTQPDFDVYQSKQFTIDCDKPVVHISIDGEVRPAQSPLYYRILPKKLKVINPL